MPDSAPNPELLRSLGRLVRGLSALFWGLPLALIVCVGTASAGWFRDFWVIPPMAVTGLLWFGLWELGSFQKQERPWHSALDRAKLLAWINFGLSPFLYWRNQVPDHRFFGIVTCIFALSGLVFLFNLNLVLLRLGAMLPDETLRHEMRQFTALNRNLLFILVLLSALYITLAQMPRLPPDLEVLFFWLDRSGLWMMLLLFLLPLAITMALLWKTKEVILDGVFGTQK